MQPNPTAPAAILYGAKSTEDTRGSIGTQLDDARIMAEREGYEVVGTYSDEARSAYSGNRGPQLLAAKEHAVRLVSKGAQVAIFVQHSDRIARGDGVHAKQVIQHVWEAQAAGYSFRSVQDDMTFTEQSGLMAFVMGMRNHEDSKRKGAATAAGIRREVMNGRWHGPAPFGYRAVGQREERHLVVDEVTAAIVRRVFNEYVTGGAGVGLIAHNLDMDGVRPPRGDRWDRHSVANILDQPAYIGLVKVNGETFPGRHEPIVEEGVWLRAATQRQARKPGSARIGRPPLGTHLLTGGLLRCGECGAGMTPRTPRGRQARYDCSTRSRTGGHTRCGMKGVIRADVDEPLLAYLESVVFDVEATRQVIAEEHERRSTENAALIAQAERSVSEADAALARIRADYVAGAITAADWQGFQTELTETREAAAREVEQLTVRAQQFTAEAAGFDVDGEAAARLAALREAVAGEVTGAEGLGAVRVALQRVFEAITLVRTEENELVIVPRVRELAEVGAWINVGEGQALVQAQPERMAVPGKQGDTEGS